MRHITASIIGAVLYLLTGCHAAPPPSDTRICPECITVITAPAWGQP